MIARDPSSAQSDSGCSAFEWDTLLDGTPGDRRGPPYRSMLRAIQAAIANGRLKEGERLPPHRDLARSLGISMTTVARAYREAQALGLITSRVGQGTFVRSGRTRVTRSRADAAIVNMGLNIVPPGRQLGDLRQSISGLARAEMLEEVFAYQPHQGVKTQRDGLAAWLATGGYRPAGDQLVITNGAQHGIDLAVRLAPDAGLGVLVEETTYSGFKAIAASSSINLVPVAMDEEGILPQGLEQACDQYPIRTVYLMPTLQSPTGRTMGQERRVQIAQIIERRRLFLIEDDVYGFFHVPKPTPISAHIPHQAIYLASLSKCIAPGFRVGMMVVPPALVERAALAVHATSWMAPSALAHTALDMIADGTLATIIEEKRHEAQQRYQMFRRILAPEPHSATEMPFPGFHVWFKLPSNWTATGYFMAARQQGILLTPPEASTLASKQPNGIRLCLGGCDSRAELEAALTRLRELIENPTPNSFLIV